MVAPERLRDKAVPAPSFPGGAPRTLRSSPMFALLPYLFALVIAEGAGADGQRAVWPLAGWNAVGPALAGTLVGWALLCAVANRLVARTRRHSAMAAWDWVAQGLMLAWFAWLCLGWGWARWAPGQAVTVLPFAAMLCVHWFFLAVSARGVSGQPWTRGGMLLHQLRFSALPLLMGLTVLTDLARLVEARISTPVEVVLGVIGLELMMLLVLVLVPALMVRMWGARPLPPGPQRDRLVAACDAMGVRVRQVMRWPVPGGRMYNAAVLGVAPRLRYVLFTDDLLRDFDERHVLAVLGHELGHARHGHLWLYFLFANVVMSLMWLAHHLHWLAIERGWILPTATAPVGGFGDVIIGILALVLIWRIVFGWLSRGCERQADLAGATLAGEAAAMEEALKTVARLSGQPENAPNWRHYSIAERVDFLRRVHADPTVATRHHRRMRFSLILLLVVMAGSLALNWYLNPRTRAAGSSDPRADIQRWQQRDGDLATALARADAGEPRELAAWFQRANVREREALAVLHLEMFGRRDADAVLLYRQRHRLTAMSGIDTGDPFLNLEIDNFLAYVLVASPEPPTKADLGLAQRLLPALEQSVAATPNNHIYDTIGCVHYQLGHHAKARDAFANALDQLARDRRIPDDDRATRESLYRQRLSAATAAATGERVVPLPLENGTQPEAAPTEMPRPPQGAPSSGPSPEPVAGPQELT